MARLLIMVIFGLVATGYLFYLFTMFFDKIVRKDNTPTEKTIALEEENKNKFIASNSNRRNKTPKAIKEPLLELQEIAENPKTEKQIHNLIYDIGLYTHELFERLEDQEGGSVATAEAEYINTLSKLSSLLGEKYYLDIVDNSYLWDNAQERKNKIIEAVTAVKEQLVSNIRQVNNNSELEFNVMVKSLLKNNNNVQMKKLYEE